ncbi:hypothetical protein [Bacteriovorax sp. DB6_IX]|uniref:hypothetical protein n=1 Tax=Bacteriovorax sp. DB6_IX TaxID=1353530 RepID=UPI00038A1A33|nr:hypothetical protein [Bacteriovorax sp. DB6_IX]EQC51665.1 hypothetical protein M901_2747 [Bacteriovorax sp. DB6_IX]
MDKQVASEIILENLSFYEWMNIENILISIDPVDLVLIDEISLDDLKDLLDSLVKEGRLRAKELDGELKYKRVQKKTLKSKLLRFLK